MSGARGELESRVTFTCHYGSQACQDPIALLEEQAAELVPIGDGRMSALSFTGFVGAAYRTWLARRRRGFGFSSVATRIWPASEESPRRSGSCCLTATASMRQFPARGMGCEATGSKRSCRRPRERLQASRQAAIIRDLAGEYRQAIRHLATTKTLVVWYARATVGDIRSCCAQASGNQIKVFDTTAAKGRRKDSARAFEGLP